MASSEAASHVNWVVRSSPYAPEFNRSNQHCMLSILSRLDNLLNRIQLQTPKLFLNNFGFFHLQTRDVSHYSGREPLRPIG